jgi:hypothetical protein
LRLGVFALKAGKFNAKTQRRKGKKRPALARLLHPIRAICVIRGSSSGEWLGEDSLSRHNRRCSTIPDIIKNFLPLSRNHNALKACSCSTKTRKPGSDVLWADPNFCFLHSGAFCFSMKIVANYHFFLTIFPDGREAVQREKYSAIFFIPPRCIRNAR